MTSFLFTIGRLFSDELETGSIAAFYRAVRLDVGSFQSDGDAVEEDENQNHVVKQFVRAHTLAPRAESKSGNTE